MTDGNDKIFAIEVEADSKVYCGVSNCKNSTTIKKLGLFPIPSKDRRKMRCKWLRNIGYRPSKKETRKPEDILVCEAHFKHCYKNYIAFISQDKSLTIDAIPTENVPYKNPLEDILDGEIQAFSDELEQETTEISKDETITRKILDDMDKNMLTQFCEKYIGNQLTVLINIQRKLLDKPDNYIMEFTDEFKRVIVSIYMENTRAYHVLLSFLRLPPPADIEKFIQSKPKVISENFMSLLKNKVETMSPDQINCALCLYLLSIEPSYDYDRDSDIILGSCHNTNDAHKTLTPVKYALVAMVRGMCDDWHQIVTFSLLPNIKDQRDFNEFIRPWIENIVMKLLGIGLTINVLIPSTDNLLINAFVYMRISEEVPYLEVNGKKIFYLYDPFNLLKLVTTNMRRKEDDMSSMWGHIRKFCKIDGVRGYKLAPYLTKETFDAKPNQLNQEIFQNSAQILSLNTAAGISFYVDFGLMAQPFKRTVKFLQKINCLFDTKRNQIHTNMFSSHLFEKYDDDIWMELFTYFKELKPPNSTYNGDNFVDCIIATLRNIRLLRENNKIYIARFVNQDPLAAIIDEARLQYDLKKKLKAIELVQVMKKNLMQSAVLHDKKTDGSLAMKKFVEMANQLIDMDIIYQKNMDISDFCTKT